MNKREKFNSINPGTFFLEEGQISELQDYLRQMNWITAKTVVTKTEKAGEGNMNCVLRVQTGKRSFIIKQSRPWVEKFPDIEAPQDRAVTEGRFYQLIQNNKVMEQFTPQLFGVDKQANIILMEDLGQASDFTFLYNKGENISIGQLKQLMEFISTLHNEFPIHSAEERIHNKAMRELNHEHIFQYPFAVDNGFDLDEVESGLQEYSLKFKKDGKLKREVSELGKLYLADGPVLLHGDYYPGSWLSTVSGVKVIDPEFCFHGRAEFELGVMSAHFKMAEQPQDLSDKILKLYKKPDGFVDQLHQKFAGVEIMRRIIGLAQLPLSIKPKRKKELMEEAYEMICG